MTCRDAVHLAHEAHYARGYLAQSHVVADDSWLTRTA